MPDQKINVDININSDALNQLPKYKAGFDSLRDAVNNLNKEIANSTDKLSKLNTQNKEAENWGTKLKTTVYNLADTYNTLKTAIKEVSSSFSGWAGIAAAAFTLITTYGPQVLDFLSEMFKSDRVKEAAKNLKNYNEMMANYIENVSGGLSKTQTLLAIAKEERQFHKNRIDAIQQLNKLDPEHLKNLTLKNINTKEGKILIDEYTKSLQRAAVEEAAMAQSKPVIENKLKAERELIAAQKIWFEYKSGKKKDERTVEGSSFTGPGMGSGSNSVKSTKDDAEKDYNNKLKKYQELNKELKAIQNKTNHDLIQFVAKPIINKSKNKEYWDAELLRQQELLSKLDSSSNTFATQAKPISNQIKKAQQMLALYDVSTKQKINIKATNTDTKPKHEVSIGPDPVEEKTKSIARSAQLTLQGYVKEISETEAHFAEMKSKYISFLDEYSKMGKDDKEKHKKDYEAVNATLEQYEKEHRATLASITRKFQDEDIAKLTDQENQLNQISKDARKQAFDQLQKDYMQKQADVDKILEQNKKVESDLQNQIFDLAGQDPRQLSNAQIAANQQKIEELEKLRSKAESAVARAKAVSEQLRENNIKDTGKLVKGFAQDDEVKAESKVQGEINETREGGHESAAIKKEIELLKLQHNVAVNAAKERGEATTQIDAKFAKQKADLENKLISSKIHAGDKYIDAVLKNTKKDSAIYKAAFLAKKATAIADVIMNTKQAIIASFKGYAHMPFIGQALAIAQGAFIATQGAMSIADIAKQKPGFAQGGQYVSDGRGALLSGYSRTDNTNAYLRSGEAVVVSEAMRNPWARNLVSAINVAHGGRDFSMPNPGKGYAIGGIFTDGGNANRYYSQPVNDQKDMANTLAYQLINNFPPIYVDVKDVNNQQSILAQTVDRVNL